MPHVLLSHHGGLLSGQVIAVSLAGFIEVPFVLDVLREVVDGQCCGRSSLHWFRCVAIEY